MQLNHVFALVLVGVTICVFINQQVEATEPRFACLEAEACEICCKSYSLTQDESVNDKCLCRKHVKGDTVKIPFFGQPRLEMRTGKRFFWRCAIPAGGSCYHCCHRHGLLESDKYKHRCVCESFYYTEVYNRD